MKLVTLLLTSILMILNSDSLDAQRLSKMVSSNYKVEKQLNDYLQKVDSFRILEKDLEMGEAYSKKVLTLCKGRDCGEKILEAKLNLAAIALQNGDYYALENFEKQEKIGQKSLSPLLKAKFLTLLGQMEEGHLGKKHLLQAIEIYQDKAPNNFNLIVAYQMLIDKYILDFNTDSIGIAVADLERVVSRHKYPQVKIDLLEKKAVFFNRKGDNAKFLLIALQMREIYKKHYFNSLAYWNNEINHTVAAYYQNKRYDDALIILDEALLYFEAVYRKKPSQGTVKNLFTALIYKINVYRMLGKHTGIFPLIDEAEKYGNIYDENIISPTERLNLYLTTVLRLRLYLALNRNSEAEEQTYKLINLLQKESLPVFHQAMLLGAISKFFIPTNTLPNKEVRALIPLLQQIIEKQSKLDNIEVLHRFLFFLQIHEGNPQSTAAAFRSYVESQDSFYSRRSLALSQDLLVKYETKNKEQQIELQQKSIEQRTIQLTVLALGILILLVALRYLWYQKKTLKKQVAIIEEQRQELKSLYESKNLFFTNVAHEIRTPLTLIEGPVSILIKGHHTPDKSQELLKIITRNVFYLKKMIEQVLELSQSENKPSAIRASYFNFSEMLSTLISDFIPLATYQNVTFTFPSNIDTHIVLKTDGEKLFTVIKNVLSNAFKYTPTRGQVDLTYLDTGRQICITITDNGVGISNEDLPHIFERFFQTKMNDKPIEGGTGIGLAICKEYMKNINGEITVSSEVSRGTTFTIIFPKEIEALVEDEATLSFLGNVQQYDFLKPTFYKTSEPLPKILIVEDNMDMCRYLQSILEQEYELTFANNGQEALNTVSSVCPDIILTDLMMPIMNGVEFIKNIKEQDIYRGLPIIVLTAQNKSTDRLEALRIGIDDYIVKPFNQEELKTRIANLLHYQANRMVCDEEKRYDENEYVAKTADTQVRISDNDLNWLKDLEELVQKRIQDVEFNINLLCIEMAISPSQFYRRIKLLTGFSPKEYLNQVRYHKARTLLENKQFDSVKRVAYAVGFKDEKNFSRNFKERFGKYPSEYLE